MQYRIYSAGGSLIFPRYALTLFMVYAWFTFFMCTSNRQQYICYTTLCLILQESEEAGILLLKNFKLNLYSVQCTRSSDGYNALHIAADNDFTSLTKKILDSGFSRLLWVQDTTGHYPVEIALDKCHYRTASLMIREMDDR